jgi:hypothetical protein
MSEAVYDVAGVAADTAQGGGGEAALPFQPDETEP